MKQILSLGGTWLAETTTKDGTFLSIPATVPGMIHLDLERAGILPPMFWRDNAEQCQWVEHCTWTYSCTFQVPKELDLRRAVLQFDGLDTYAEIELNGQVLGQTANMFVPHRFAVPSIVHAGENTLRITFTPYQEHIVGKPLDFPAAFNKAERVHVRRMQCTFYWDWVNRFITFGPWREVKLICYDESDIESLFAYTHDIAETSASVNLHLNTEYDREDMVAMADLVLLDPDGEEVWAERGFHIIDRQMRLQADLPHPQLWWPVGYGPSPLYTLQARLYTEDGRLLDEQQTRFGIRTVRIEQLKDAPGSVEHQKALALRGRDDRAGSEPGSGFNLLVNGKRIFCKGGNWVPADPFPCRVSEEKYRWLVRYAAEAGLNLLRVWGGGIYEDEAFYRACDEMGVMISQDFMFACAHYPENDEEFLENVRYEIPLAVKALRNHPSIVWWAGDNENACHYDWDARRAPGVRLCREVFYPTLDRLDPSRPFRPTSPSGGLNNCSPTVGDCHMSWWREPGDYRQNVKRLGRFASESVFFGSPLLTTLRKFMTEEDIADPSGAMYEYHVKDNPHKPEGAPTLYGGMRLESDAIMGTAHSPHDRVRRDAYLQYEWARLSMEGARRNKWYTAGLQYWMYNDCWPAVGLSTVDYYLVPKAAYYALKRAARPLIASINDLPDGSFECWTLNDSLTDRTGRMVVYVQSFSGERRMLRSMPFASRANENDRITVLSAEETALGDDALLVCELISGQDRDRAVYFPNRPAQTVFPKAHYTVCRDEAAGALTIKAQTYVRSLMLDGDAVASDNFFDLFPGEEKTVTIECLNGSRLADISICCLNETVE